MTLRKSRSGLHIHIENALRWAQVAGLFVCLLPAVAQAATADADPAVSTAPAGPKPVLQPSAGPGSERGAGAHAATGATEGGRLKMSLMLATQAELIEPVPLTSLSPGAASPTAGMAAGASALLRKTLLDAVLKGLVRHPEVRAAQADAQRSEAELDVSRTGYLPTFEMSAGPETGAGSKAGYNLTVSQMLYDWGKVGGSVDEASAGMRQKGYELALVRERVAMEVIDTCLNLIAAQQRLQAVEDHRQRLQALYARTDLRSRDGYSDASERSRAALSLARAVEQIDIERGRLQEAEAQYRFLVGEPHGNLNVLLGDGLPADLVRFASLTEAITKSPAYKKAVEEVEAAEARIRNARAALLPELRLEGSALRREIGGTITSDWMITLRLRMNAFQGNSNLLKVDVERHRLEAAQWKRDNQELETRRKLSMLSQNVTTLRARANSLQAQRLQAVRLRELYEDQFQAALRDVNDLLIVETELLESERQLVDALTERLRAQFQAAAQVGMLHAALEGRPD